MAYAADPVLYLYTSLTAGSSHIITATSRLETILKANKIPFSALDVATDEKARMLWGRRSRGKKLPGLVRYGEIIGDLEQVEEWNEYGELKMQIGTVPNVNGPTITPPSKYPSNLPQASTAAPSKLAPPPAVRTPSSIQIQEPVMDKSVDEGPSTNFAMRQIGNETAAKAAEKNQERLQALKAAHDVQGSTSAKTKSAEEEHTPSILEKNQEKLRALKVAHDAAVPAASEGAEAAAATGGQNKEKLLALKAEHDGTQSGAVSGSDAVKQNEEGLRALKAAHDGTPPASDQAKKLDAAAVVPPPTGTTEASSSPASEGVVSPPQTVTKKPEDSSLSVPAPSTAVSSTSSLDANETGQEAVGAHHRASSLSTASKEVIAEAEKDQAIKEEPVAEQKASVEQEKEETLTADTVKSDAAKAKEGEAAGVSAED